MRTPSIPPILRRFTAALASGVLALVAVLAMTPVVAHASFGAVHVQLTVASFATYGTPVTVHVLVKDDSGSCNVVFDCNRPTGTVDFYDGGAYVGSATLTPYALVNHGEASLTLTGLEVGVHTFSAWYSGNFDSTRSVPDGPFVRDSQSQLTISKAPCVLNLQIEQSSSPVVFTADLGAAGHTGTVDFLTESGLLYYRTSVVDGRYGRYSFPSYIYTNPITLRAVYYGDSRHQSCASGTASYTPAPVTTASGSVTVPDPNDDFYVVDIDGTLVADVLANDEFSGFAITLELKSDAGPTHGTAELGADNTIVYRPESGYVGSDSFVYTIGETGSLSRYQASVAIQVKCVEKGTADSYTVGHNSELTVGSPGVAFNDSTCGQPVTVASGPSHGAVELATDGGFVYTPDTDFSGADSFTYVIGTTVPPKPVRVTLIVSGTRCVVTLAADDYTAPEGKLTTPLPGVAGNDQLCGNVLVVDRAPAHGTVTLAPNGGFTYEADAGYAGTDSFTYRIGTGGPAAPAGVEAAAEPSTATVRLTVTRALAGGSRNLPTTGPTTTPTLWLAVLWSVVGVLLVGATRRRRA